jgi:ArsR family transcriptional regulator, arsenate/arsenite/antimonite-responsive transcriptional repressor
MRLLHHFDTSRNMDETRALAALSALGQPTRLALFRVLVQDSCDGVAAGRLAERLAVRPNTLSTHLSLLEEAGLIRARREGRSILYTADRDGLRALLGWLLQDCCGGRPETCAAILDEIACAC